MEDEAHPGPSGLTPSPSKMSPKKKNKSPKKRKAEGFIKKNVKRSKIDNVTSRNKKWVCEICKKKISNKSYRDHVLRHTNEKKYQCTVCEDRFKTMRDIKRHMVRHNKNITISCNTCNTCKKKFNSKTCLENHICSKQRYYECDDCKKVFKTKNNLRVHIITIHLGGKAHKCNICEKRFYYSYKLKNHQIKKHSERKHHVCDQCGAVYKFIHHLNKHIQKKHNDNPLANEQRGEHFLGDDQNSKESGQSDSSDNAKSKLSDSDLDAMCDATLQAGEEKLIEDFQEIIYYDCDTCYNIFDRKEDLEKHKNCHTDSSNI